MIVDSFYQQGNSHEVCEDYALHGDNFAIVSDGCSNGGGSSIESDWGSRLLCKAAEDNIRLLNPDQFISVVAGQTVVMKNSLPNLNPKCLTATLMVLRALDDKFQALVVGDGVIGGKRRDGRWKIHTINFSGGAPYYLKYKMYGEDAFYFTEFGDQYKVQSYFGRLFSEEDVPEDYKLADREKFWSQQVTFTENQRTLDPNKPYNVFEFPLDEYEFAFVCSDGMESFQKLSVTPTGKFNENILILDALRVVMDFKVFRPGFARLQRNWAFKAQKQGTLLSRGWKNFDDVSMGIIHV